jgi:hypothetical protein
MIKIATCMRIALIVTIALLQRTAEAGCPSKDTRAKGFDISFDDKLMLKVKAVDGDKTSYDILNGSNVIESVTSKFGVFPVSIASGNRSTQYSYDPSVEGIFPPQAGQEFVLSTSVTTGTAFHRYDFAYRVERADHIAIGACSYDGLWIKRTYRGVVTSWFWIPDLMIFSSMKTENTEANGQMVSVQARKALSVSQE